MSGQSTPSRRSSTEERWLLTTVWFPHTSSLQKSPTTRHLPRHLQDQARHAITLLSQTRLSVCDSQYPSQWPSSERAVLAFFKPTLKERPLLSHLLLTSDVLATTVEPSASTLTEAAIVRKYSEDGLDLTRLAASLAAASEMSPWCGLCTGNRKARTSRAQSKDWQGLR
jgi:hypothetical protein